MIGGRFTTRAIIRHTPIFVGAFAIFLYALSTLRTIAPAGPWVGVLTWVGAAFAGARLLLLVDVFVQWAWRRINQRRQLKHAASAPQMDRRRFIANMIVPATAGVAGGVGVVGSAATFKVFRETVLLPKLPHALDGFRIGLITDPHIGDWVAPERLARAVDVLNQAEVDLQVLGGDLIDDLSLLDPTFAALERCHAPHGMLAVLGNHEKAGLNLLPILEAYERRRAQERIRLLVDAQLRLAHHGAPLWVIGIDYPMHPGGRHTLPRAEHEAFMRTSADKAFQGVRTEEPVLCLTHHPAFFPVATERGAWLTLAGHMHGGQWAPLGHPLFASSPYIRGHYRRGSAHLYVSCGLGDWLPSRIGVPHEVTIITLARPM